MRGQAMLVPERFWLGRRRRLHAGAWTSTGRGCLPISARINGRGHARVNASALRDSFEFEW